jgi:hypothetical protein
MRTTELIDDNAQQALELLIRYGTSSRTLKLALPSLLLLTLYSRCRPEPTVAQLYYILDTRDTTGCHHQLPSSQNCRR